MRRFCAGASRSGGDKCPLLFLEQVDLLLGQILRRVEAEMPPGIGGQHAAARRALDEALLDQIGLDDVLDARRAARDSAGRDRLDADRPAAEIVGDHREIAPVELVEAERIDLQPRQRLVGDRARRHAPSPATAAKSRTRRSSRPAMRGVPRARRAISSAPSSPSGMPQDARAAPHDLLQLLDRIEIEPHRNAETVAQRRGQQAEPRRRGDQRELGEVDLHRARRRPLADDQVELVILHRRIEDFLDRRVEPVDLVDEQHVAVFEIGQQRREIAGLGDHRAGGRAEIDAELARHDLRQRRLAEPGRADEQHMVERLAAALGRLDEHLEIGPRRRLADELVERLRPQASARHPRRAFPERCRRSLTRLILVLARVMQFIVNRLRPSLQETSMHMP